MTDSNATATGLAPVTIHHGSGPCDCWACSDEE